MNKPTISRTHYDRLDQRRKWLDIRQAGKAQLGWEIEYDISERDALAAALEVLSVEDDRPTTPDPGEGWRIAEGEDWKDERCELWSFDRWIQRGSVGCPFTAGGHYRIPIDPAPKHPPVPEGWRLLEDNEIVEEGDQYPFCGDGEWCASIADIDVRQRQFDYPHIRRIEPTYRPFASAEEAMPFFDEKLRFRQTGSIFRIGGISDERILIGLEVYSPSEAFNMWERLDGSPFGVEVKP